MSVKPTPFLPRGQSKSVENSLFSQAYMLFALNLERSLFLAILKELAESRGV